MKKIIYTLIALFLSTSFFAQHGFNYKTIIKNNGVILANQSLDIRFTIYSSDPNDGGTQLYRETHTTTTNANGIAIVKMGEGSTSNSWNSIIWGPSNYYKTEYNIGSGYIDMGTQRFDFVPATEWARTADYATYVSHVSFANIEYKPTTLAGYGITDADPSTTNELQNLSITGDQLSISSGNTVTLPSGTTYTAGTGIGISGGVITNSGDTDATDDFDGNYNNLTNTPIQFLDASGDAPTSISTDVHRMSGVALGNTLVEKGRLDIRVTGSDTTIPQNVGLGIVNSSAAATTQKGIDVALTGNSNSVQSGMYNTIINSGSGRRYGVFNHLGGTGTGSQYGIENYINNSNNILHYGMYNELDGAGSGTHYGVVNQLSGAGTGLQYGIRNTIDNLGNGNHFAIHNDMSGTGTGTHAAMYNTLSGSGSGYQYGVKTEITNTSTGQHYGFNAILSGSGDGNKYGSYNLINPSAGGTHFAVYGSATKSDSFAGYFVGDVRVSQKLLAPDSGTNADMKAYIYGKINASSAGATIVTNASSSGFTIVRTDVGQYKVTFGNNPNGNDKYMVIGTMVNTKGFISVTNYASYFIVYTYATDDSAADKNFSFVVYKK